MKPPDHYVYQINKRKQARVDISGNYEKTDNVNNAGSATQIQWQGRTWQKSTQSLPKKAEGVRYDVDVQKDVQIDDNHYVSAEFDFDGVRYWDNGDYDEQTMSLGLGYKHQNAVGSVAVMPFASYLWFGGDDYYHEAGVNANINHRLSQRLNVGGGMSYTKRYYDDERLAHRYDSTIKSANVAYRYVVSPNAMVFGGADVRYDGTQDKEYASVRYGVNVGVLAQADNGIGGRVSLRYAKRVFDEPETLFYGFVRRDDEYYVQTAFWHDKWQYKGFVPNFNISYQKIDSNMKDLYTRDGLRSFISIEKRF